MNRFRTKPCWIYVVKTGAITTEDGILYATVRGAQCRVTMLLQQVFP